MPMDNGGRAGLIREVHAKPLAGGEANAGTSIRTDKPEDLGRPAAHLEHACSGDETLRDSESGVHHTGQDGQDAGSECGAKKVTARVGITRSKTASRSVGQMTREKTRC